MPAPSGFEVNRRKADRAVSGENGQDIAQAESKPFPPCSVCQEPGLGLSGLCERHQPPAPAWSPRWKGDRWTDLERSK